MDAGKELDPGTRTKVVLSRIDGIGLALDPGTGTGTGTGTPPTEVISLGPVWNLEP